MGNTAQCLESELPGQASHLPIYSSRAQSSHKPRLHSPLSRKATLDLKVFSRPMAFFPLLSEPKDLKDHGVDSVSTSASPVRHIFYGAVILCLQPRSCQLTRKQNDPVQKARGFLGVSPHDVWLLVKTEYRRHVDP